MLQTVRESKRREPGPGAKLAGVVLERGLSSLSAGFDAERGGRLRPPSRGRGGSGGDGLFGGRTAHGLGKLRRDCRDEERNGELAATIVQGAVDLDIEAGFVTTARTGSRRFNKLADEAFNQWANSMAVDMDGIRTLDGLAAAVDAAWYTDGDSLIVFVDDEGGPGALQFVEADRIRNPRFQPDSKTMSGGFERDGAGRVVRIHLAEYDDRGHLGMESRAVEPEFCLHLPNPMDLSGGRGRRVPQLARVLLTLERIGSVDEAVQVAAWMSACIAAFINLERPQDDGAFDGAETGETGPSGNAVTRKTETWGPGMIKRMGLNEKVTFSPPGQPGANLPEYLRMQVARIGALMGVPQCMLLLDGKGLNLSTIRSIIQLAWRRALRRQEALRCGFYQPVRRWWTARAIRRGVLPYVSDWEKCEAISPPAPVMDPMTEIAAGREAVMAGFTSRRRAAMQIFGHEIEDIDRERAEEQQMERDLGIQVEHTPGAIVTGGNPEPEAVPEPEQGSRASRGKRRRGRR